MVEPVTNNPCVVLPEIINDPLITAGVVLPSYGNDVLEPTPDNAYEAVVANEADVGVNVIDVAALAVVANDAVGGINVILVAALAVVANDELPNNDPVIPCVTPRLPLIANDPDVVNDPLNTTMSVVSSNDPVIV